MESKKIRQTFLNFFHSKQHLVGKSAPIVVKNDPTLMFTNAGMNQFKDYFLGNKEPKDLRIANSQKCLRVSGKHNDLEEVGVDTYHHTMFEMLGNWSFGDYFKAEAIEWAWELLTEVYQIPKNKLYVTVFEGDEKDGVAADNEATETWKKFIDADRIILASKKDNFWEMGDTGPCGPCSEIHVDLRSEEEKKLIDGKILVNQDHPQVVEIWNLVFIQYNRKSNGELELLPAKHVDTGMGFERLAMALQNKQSNYDTDVFMPLINKVSEITGVKYGENEKIDIAIRVISDHLRAIAFTIHDGQLPSNTGAGYVIRRILRRAVRYAYSYLNYKQPIINQLLGTLVGQFDELYPDLVKNQAFVKKVIEQEEVSFLRTLETGLKRFKQIESKMSENEQNVIDGDAAFELYDTFGFPIDLTRLIASEKALEIDEEGFEKAMQAQKERARAATKVDTGDWAILSNNAESVFVGYDTLTTDSQVVKYREVKQKKNSFYQIVLDQTPFYAESGGQVGDVGYLQFGDEKISITDTKKENNLIVHYAKKLPEDITLPCQAVVNATKRYSTNNNHSATHLLHAALREVLGNHVHQKGSLVNADYLRFDFSHFEKVTEEHLRSVEKIVNEKIRANIALEELRNVPIEKAKAMGAMALFGEKYGDFVRVIVFDKNYSVELCGGTHVAATGEIGFCKLTLETSVAAGVRRIEAVTGTAAYELISNEFEHLNNLNRMFKKPKNLSQTVQNLIDENTALRREIERMQMESAGLIKNGLKTQVEAINGLQFIGKQIEASTADMVKKIAYDLRNEVPNLFLVLGAKIDGKAHLTLMFDDELVKSKNLNAGKLIRTLAKNIQGGGGGQAFYASAGGRNAQGIDKAIHEAKQLAESL